MSIPLGPGSKVVPVEPPVWAPERTGVVRGPGKGEMVWVLWWDGEESEEHPDDLLLNHMPFASDRGV